MQDYPPFEATPTAKVAKAASDDGEWGPVISWPHIPVSAATLPDGRILSWASNQRDAFPVAGDFTFAATWDPNSGQFQELNHNQHDMFCGHTVMLEDGRVMVNGGRKTVRDTSTFDFATNSWQRIDNMVDPRWYPTTVALPNDRVFTVSGNGGPNTAEVWTEGQGWQKLTNVNWSPIANAAGFESLWWPYVFLAPDGNLFHAGPTDAMHWVDPTGSGSLTNAGVSVPGNWYPKHAGAVMYDEGKLLIAGGAFDTGGGSTNKAYTVDINGATPQVNQITSMQRARRFANAVMLPNGEVLMVGGNTSGTKFSDNGTVLAAEIWNPDTDQWREVADMAVPRQNSVNGTIRDYACYVSTDGINWGSPVAQGTFAPDSTAKTVFF